MIDDKGNRVKVAGPSTPVEILGLNDVPNACLLYTSDVYKRQAYRGFFGCRHFSQCNEFLKANGVEPIDWQIENI